MCIDRNAGCVGAQKSEVCIYLCMYIVLGLVPI